MPKASVARSPVPASKPVTPSHNDLETAINVYTWATIEAKNLLQCISIAADHGGAVDDDIRPSIGIAIDGVARLLAYVQRQFEHVDTNVSTEQEVSHG